jgi:hypothetical protein
MKSLVIVAVLIGSLCARAELPPYVYQELQKEAPELLQIEVLDSKKKPSPADKSRADGARFYHVELTAKVLEVERTDSNLKPGDVIRIAYGRTERPKNSGWVGPSEIPVLKKGVVSTAYLGKGEESDVYSPAARGFSFETLPTP